MHRHEPGIKHFVFSHTYAQNSVILQDGERDLLREIFLYHCLKCTVIETVSTLSPPDPVHIFPQGKILGVMVCLCLVLLAGLCIHTCHCTGKGMSLIAYMHPCHLESWRPPYREEQVPTCSDSCWEKSSPWSNDPWEGEGRGDQQQEEAIASLVCILQKHLYNKRITGCSCKCT